MTLMEWLLPGLFATPNIHPALVHFPIAFYLLALFVSVMALRRWPDLANLVRPLAFLGTLTMLAAALAGFQAEESIAHGPGTVVSAHRNLMIVGLVLSGLVTAVAAHQKRDTSRRSRVVLAVGLLSINAVVLMGADRGALVAFRLFSGLSLSASGTHLADLPTQGGPPRADSVRGRILYDQLDCASCHGPTRRLEAPGIPPTLDYAGSKMRPAWMEGYLRHPHRIRFVDATRRPVARMPDFQLSAKEASDLAAFLASRQDTVRFPETPLSPMLLTQEEVSEGAALFRRPACLGCHRLGTVGNNLGPALDDAWTRLRPAYICTFLRDPQGILPGTAMKGLHLRDDEARALTAALSGLNRLEADSLKSNAESLRR